MKFEKIKIGISHGDINGIGYEIIFKSLSDARILDYCTPIIYGSSKVAAYHRKALNINNFSLNNIKDANDAYAKRVNIINCIDDNIRVELGKLTQSAGESSYCAVSQAVSDLKKRKIDALLTVGGNTGVLSTPIQASCKNCERLPKGIISCSLEREATEPNVVS